MAVLAGTLLIGCSATGSGATSGSTTTVTVDSSAPSTTATTSGSTSTEPPETTLAPTTAPPTTHSSPTTTRPVEADPLDWDGTSFDFGDVTQASDTRGGVEISFDRYQIYDGDRDLIEGAQIDSEPLIYANTDVPFVNSSERVRAYRLVPDVDIQVLANVDAICRGMVEDQQEVEPIYQRVTPEQLLPWSATGADLAPPGFEGPGQDAVTFDRTGAVTRLVFLSSC